MSKVFLKSVGFTEEELRMLISPITSEDGTVRHKADIMVNPNKIKEIISQVDTTKENKIRLHHITVKMIDVLNEVGINQYLPDKFKPIFSALFAMSLTSDEKFISIVGE